MIERCPKCGAAQHKRSCEEARQTLDLCRDLLGPQVIYRDKIVVSQTLHDIMASMGWDMSGFVINEPIQPSSATAQSLPAMNPSTRRTAPAAM